MKIRLLTAVWGKQYIDTFVRAGLRSILASGNAPDLASTHEVVYTILTTPDDARLLQRAPQFASLRATLNVEISESAPGTFDAANYGSHGVLWQRGIELAQSNGEVVFFVIPDAVYANGTLVEWAKYFSNGAKAVFTPGPQVALETTLPELEAKFPGNGAFNVDRHELLDLVFRHLHPLHATMRSESRHRPPHPEYDLRLVPGRGMVIREIVAHPFCIDPSYFETLRHYGPEDRLESLAFAPCSVVGLEPILKRVAGYYRPLPLDEIRRSNLAGWWDCFATPACEVESNIPFELCLRPDEQWRAGCRRAVAAGAFYRSQVIAAGRFYRLFSELRDRGCYFSASILAAAYYAARLRRLFSVRGRAILLVPTDQALNSTDREHIRDLLQVGRERQLVDLLRDHVLLRTADVASSHRLGRLRARRSQGTPDDPLVTDRGLPAYPLLKSASLAGKPSFVEPFTIYPVDRVLWRKAAESALTMKPCGGADTLAAPASSAGIDYATLAMPFQSDPRSGTTSRDWYTSKRLSTSRAGARAVRALRQGGLRIALRKVRKRLVGASLRDLIGPIAVGADATEALKQVRNYRALRAVQYVLTDLDARLDGRTFRSAPLAFVNNVLMRHGLMDSQGIEAAERLLRGLVDKHPRWSEAWLELAFLREDQGRADEALACFEHAMRGARGGSVSAADPHPRAVAAASHGRLLAAMGRQREAGNSFAFSLALDPYQRIAAIQYASILRQQGNIDQALIYFAEGMYYQDCRWALPQLPRDTSEVDVSLLARASACAASG